jgi:acetyltransferase-like isoleucine patch superfamily enzyme
MSGSIYIDDFSFAGHNVSLLTGTHDLNKKNSERRDVIPLNGNDIRIGKGVWICSNATIIGPCTIGDNSVVAAGSVVTTDIPSNVIYGGIPAKLIKNINFD